MSAAIDVLVYNVGFGDSILIRAPGTGGRVVKILIDCGSISFGDTGVSTASMVERIIADVTDDDGVARIDLVVATHRHRDHISGFGRDEWRAVEVSEVWLPWTEDPENAAALQLALAQNQLAKALVDSTELLASDVRFSDAQVELITSMGFNSLTNDDSMKMLRTGFAGKHRRRYLKRRKRPRRPRSLDGIAVHVLGPSQDVDVLKRMDPPSAQSYLAMLGTDLASMAHEDAGARPASDDRPFPHLPLMDYLEYGSPEQNNGMSRQINDGQARGQLKKLAASDAALSAAGLDHALNNTSLMLCFEIGEHFLLFPGDSQWGSWELALGSVWSAELLGRTTFYKIAHHGSHNATPKKFVELLAQNTWAVASVTPYAQWKKIPKVELLEALAEKSPDHVFTTMTPPDQPPAGMEVIDDGKVLRFTL